MTELEREIWGNFQGELIRLTEKMNGINKLRKKLETRFFQEKSTTTLKLEDKEEERFLEIRPLEIL